MDFYTQCHQFAVLFFHHMDSCWLFQQIKSFFQLPSSPVLQFKLKWYLQIWFSEKKIEKEALKCGKRMKSIGKRRVWLILCSHFLRDPHSWPWWAEGFGWLFGKATQEAISAMPQQHGFDAPKNTHARICIHSSPLAKFIKHF